MNIIVENKTALQKALLSQQLIESIEKCDTASVKNLIKKHSASAILNDVDTDGNTPLHLACKALSLEHHYSQYIKIDDNFNALSLKQKEFETLEKKYLDIIDQLIAAGARVDSRNFDGETPFLVAAYHARSPKIMKLLLDNKANIDATDKKGNHALLLATSITLNHSVISFLVDTADKQKQADKYIGFRNDQNETALQRALIKSNCPQQLDNVKFLLKKSQQLNIQKEIDYAYWTPLILAVQTKNKALVSFIMDEIKNRHPKKIKEIINEYNSDGNTALHMAVGLAAQGEYTKDLRDIIELLLQNGANPDRDNNRQETPVKLADKKESLKNDLADYSKKYFKDEPINIKLFDDQLSSIVKREHGFPLMLTNVLRTSLSEETKLQVKELYHRYSSVYVPITLGDKVENIDDSVKTEDLKFLDNFFKIVQGTLEWLSEQIYLAEEKNDAPKIAQIKAEKQGLEYLSKFYQEIHKRISDTYRLPPRFQMLNQQYKKMKGTDWEIKIINDAQREYPKPAEMKMDETASVLYDISIVYEIKAWLKDTEFRRYLQNYSEQMATYVPLLEEDVLKDLQYFEETGQLLFDYQSEWNCIHAYYVSYTNENQEVTPQTDIQWDLDNNNYSDQMSKSSKPTDRSLYNQQIKQDLAKKSLVRDTHATIRETISLTTDGKKFVILKNLLPEDIKAIHQQEGILLDPNVEHQGHFGAFHYTQYLASEDSTPFYLGVKILTRDKSKNDSEKEDYYHKQIHDLKIKGIIPFYGSVQVANNAPRYQLMQLGGLGSILDFKKRVDNYQSAGMITVEERYKIWMDFAHSAITTFSELHEKGFYHLDVAPRNFVVNKKGEFFLIDFGCMKHCDVDESTLTNTCAAGDALHFSPNRLQHGYLFSQKKDSSQVRFDLKKEDGWALGLTLLEAIFSENIFYADIDMNQILYSNTWDKNLFDRALSKIKNNWPKEVPSVLITLIESLLTMDEKQRPACADLLKDERFKSLALNDAERKEIFQKLIQNLPEKLNNSGKMEEESTKTQSQVFPNSFFAPKKASSAKLIPGEDNIASIQYL